jgi:Ca-activated chloride channel homolog
MRKHLLFVMFLVLVLFGNRAAANGVLISDASKGKYAKLLWTRVEVNVEGQVAMTTTTQQFLSVSTTADSVSLGFPLPVSATATRLRWREGDAAWHQATFAAQPQDSTPPSSGSTMYANLKSYLGQKPLYFPLPRTLKPDSVLTIELTYVELLSYRSGIVTFTYPNDYRLIQTTPLQAQTLTFHLSSQRTIESIALRQPAGGTTSNSGDTAVVAFERSSAVADSNYVVAYSLRATELGLFSYSTKPSDTLGYFSFVVEPDPTGSAVIRKNFAIIVDRSGSMSGTKIEQARNAATFIVNNLNEGDWFTLVDFDDIITPFRTSLVPYTTTARDSAVSYISTLSARGMTDIAGAFQKTIPYFKQAPDSVANIIIFLTDGQATSGQTNSDSILAIVSRTVKATGKSLYIFTFGIGADVNTQLLTNIAASNNGIAEFLGTDQLEARITDFYNTIRNPVLIGPKITFSSPAIIEPYPNPLPNLYKGQQLIVSGAYTAAVGGTVTFAGTAFGRPVSYQYQLQLTDSLVEKYSFLPKLWAKLKIEFLLVRYYAAPSGSALASELKAEIVALSIRYGVVSPFTSFSSSGATAVEQRGTGAGSPFPEAYQLLGNYPNPFNAGTVIKFRVATPLNHPVIAKIYNSIGQLVRTIVVAVSGEGDYAVLWDARDQSGSTAPSGAYFYVLDFGDAVLGGRMILLK